jgi:PAS domain S-box-containing protein
MVAFAGYPLKVEERVLGVIAAFARQPLTPATLQAFASVAHNLAQFIKRKRAEEAFRESEEKYRALIETTGTGYVIIDTEGRVIDANPEYVRLTGRRALQEILGRRVTEWAAQHDLARSAEAVRRCAELGFVRNLELEHVNEDGKCTPIEVNATVVPGAGGVRMVGLCRDITERKQAEEALRQSEENFEALAESASEGILIATGEEGRHVYANRRAAEITGYPIEELLKTCMRDLAHPDELAKLAERYKERLERLEVPKPYETAFLNKDGIKVPIEISPSRTIWQNQLADMVMFREITERKRAEEALRVSHRFLEIANRHTQMTHLLKEFVAELRNFTGCVAVGLRTLDAEGKIPYQAYEGFDRRFYESESPLSIGSDQCMCINVIKGTTDPKLSFYTESGSFYMNGTTRFLATVSEEEKGRTRNVCNQFGYESVALVPIRSGDNILGLIHVADYQENMVPLEIVEVLEGAAMQLGTAIERVRAEEALRESEERFRSLVENATVGIYRTTPDGHILMANPALVRMLGFDSFEDLAARNLECGGFEPSYPRSVFRERIEREGQVIGLEAAWIRRDGSVILVRESARAVRAEDGRVLHYDGIVEDITTRRHAEEGMRQLSGRLLRLQDEERRRIARELHETTAQGLAGLAINLNMVKDSAPRLSPRASACLSESLELAEQCSREIRTLCYLLHPPLVDEAGLAPALRWYTAGFAQRSGIEVHAEVSPDFGRLPSDLELTLYRIVQEALTNIHLHSGSKTARICLERRPKEIVLTVADEGHGFPSAALGMAGPESTDIGVGIPGMQERVRQLGGRLHIQTGSRGTTLRAILPLGEVTNGQTTHPTGG